MPAIDMKLITAGMTNVKSSCSDRKNPEQMPVASDRESIVPIPSPASNVNPATSRDARMG